MRKAVLYWAPLCAYSAALLVFSLRPMPEGVPDISDKLYHFTAYAVMGLLLGRVYRQKLGPYWTWAAAAASAFVFGGAVEILQGFTPTRTPDIMDAFANGAGGFIGSLLYLAIRR